MSRRKAKVEVFQGEGKQPWFWRLRWANGRIAATSEGYVNRGAATMLATKLANLLGVLVVQR